MDFLREQYGRVAKWLKREPQPPTMKTYRDSDLVYAATSRCRCGAGLAYPKNIGPMGSWDCSDILTGRAKPKGEDGAVTHDDRFPFSFYEIKSELQPSQNGATTRRE